VVLVLHAPHPEAGGLLGLRKLREHCESAEVGVRWQLADFATNPIKCSQTKRNTTKRQREDGNTPFELYSDVRIMLFYYDNTDRLTEATLAARLLPCRVSAPRPATTAGMAWHV
jgi:hypothetical protein